MRLAISGHIFFAHWERADGRVSGAKAVDAIDVITDERTKVEVSAEAREIVRGGEH